MAREPKPAVYLAAILATELPGFDFSPYMAAKDAESLVRLGETAARVALQRCNGIERYDEKARRVLASWTEQDEARADETIARVEKQAQAILAPYGVTAVSAHGDPRGFCLKFRLASGRSNSFDRETWGL